MDFSGLLMGAIERMAKESMEISLIGESKKGGLDKSSHLGKSIKFDHAMSQVRATQCGRP